MMPSIQDSLITISSPTTNPTSPDQAPLSSSPESANLDENIINQSASNLISPNSTPPLKTKSLTEIYSQTQPIMHHPLPECFLTNTNIPCELVSFSLAIKDTQWLQAMKTEFTALQHNQTWNLVPWSSFMNIINFKWIFKLKHKSDGSIERHKAQLVAKGFKQVDGFDYDETFSLVVKITIVCNLLSLAISKKWFIRQLDVSNAFLHGEWWRIISKHEHKGCNWIYTPPYSWVWEIILSLNGWRRPL